MNRRNTVTISPFTITTIQKNSFATAATAHLITYWGIYLNDKSISYTSSKELAEKTKVWIEKWLAGRL